MRLVLRTRLALVLGLALIACMSAALALAPSASALGAWWHLNATSASTPAHPGEAQIIVTASDLGAVALSSSEDDPVTVVDELPEGVEAVGVEAQASRGAEGHTSCSQASPSSPATTVTCTFAGVLPSYELLMLRIVTRFSKAKPGTNTVRARGPGIPEATLPQQLQLNTTSAPSFGLQAFATTPETGGEGEVSGGSFDDQAGSHPFQLTTTVDFNQTLASYGEKGEYEYFSGLDGVYPTAPALPRELKFTLPPGLIGDASAVPQCSSRDFSTTVAEDTVNLCPPDTAVGVVTLVANEPLPEGRFKAWSVPIFNLEPEEGEPARFGFEIESVPIVLRTSIPTGGSYGVQVSVANISQAIQVMSSQVTIWGVPGEPSHNSARGWECLGGGTWYGGSPHAPCPTGSQPSPTAFLTLPTSCTGVPEASVQGESWPAGQAQIAQTLQGVASSRFPSALGGCEALAFDPKLSIEPETQQGSTQTGLTATVRMGQPGLTAPKGTAEPALKTTTVTLPAGLQLNPSAANALEDCQAEQFGFDIHDAVEAEQTQNLAFEPGPPACPDGAKVGTLSAKTPLLPNELTGSLYLGAQDTDPFSSPLVLYLVAEDKTAGVLFKLAGSVEIGANGQLSTTFENTPQAALFNELKLHFFGAQQGVSGEERETLSTPARCGSYAATSSFDAWSGATSTPSSEPAFQVTSGPGGAPCPGATLPFVPSFKAGAANPQAGALTPFTVTIDQADGSQPLERIDVHLPPGIAALISQVRPCPEAQALSDACGPESRVGHTTAVAGLGNEPVTLGGEVYLTGELQASAGHPRAPFGLLAVTQAKAGPFDLGNVPVLSTLQIDPSTAAVTVQSEPIPKLVDGVPVDLKQLEVAVERPGNAPFEFNPTNCNAMSIAGILTGYEGTSQSTPYPFQVHNCAGLAFQPTLTAIAGGHGSKADGTNLEVKLTSPGLGQANIAKVDLQLPGALPARLGTLQQACTEAVFDTDPASCDPGSVVGHATVRTPVLADPLTGPAYLVSHGGAEFPDLEFVLQGEGVEIVLDGKTAIKKGITYSKFESAPDAPFTSFETELPAGPDSLLTPNVAEKEDFSLCTASLAMPTTVTGQDGAVVEQSTKIAVSGCGGVLPSKVRALSRAQKLAKALKACLKKRRKSKRVACERQARKRYGAKMADRKPEKR